jgi:hypothetical protein
MMCNSELFSGLDAVRVNIYRDKLMSLASAFGYKPLGSLPMWGRIVLAEWREVGLSVCLIYKPEGRGF